jgi:hypothetical protein
MRGILRAIGIAAIVVAMAAPAPAATSGELLRCEKSLHSRASSFVKAVQNVLLACTYKIENCQLRQEIDGEDVTTCLASATAACEGYSAKVLVYRTSYQGKASVGCASIFTTDTDPYVAGLGFAGVSAACGTSTVSDLVACVFGEAQCAAERSVFQLDPRAQDALATAGIAAAHPCVAP